MKFNPRSPRVWFTFLVAGANLILGIALSPLTRLRGSRPIRVVLYGHHFYGNLRAFYERADWKSEGFDVRFIYIDHRQYRRHRSSWPGIMSAFRPDHMVWAAGADVIVADRGLGLMRVLTRLRPGMVTVQVWHGVGYKGYDSRDLSRFLPFSLMLAPSKAVREEWHRAGEGPPIERIRVTGFARTDALVAPLHTRQQLEQLLGLTGGRRRILFAPTWKHDFVGRSPVPFDMKEEAFFGAIDAWASEHDVEVVFRVHLNTSVLEAREGREALQPEGLANIVFRPMAEFPLTEHLLLVSDVLVTDWSSVSTDFLILDRPILYLDVPPPFEHGFSVLNGDDRPGPRLSSMNQLLAALSTALESPEALSQRHAQDRTRVLAIAFDDTLDGRSSERCLEEIVSYLDAASPP